MVESERPPAPLPSNAASVCSEATRKRQGSALRFVRSKCSLAIPDINHYGKALTGNIWIFTRGPQA